MTTYAFLESDCPGHIASSSDAKVCGRCGIHIDGLRPFSEEPEGPDEVAEQVRA